MEKANAVGYMGPTKDQVMLSLIRVLVFASVLQDFVGSSIASYKRSIQKIKFLIFPGKHMLWILIRSASLRHF